MAEISELISVKDSSGDAVPGRKEQMLCQPCFKKDLQTTADVFCSECDEFQCNECSKAHKVYAFMKNHKLVNATEVKSKPSLDMKGMDNCDQHGELLKFFCEDEKKLCCSTCAIVDHRKCHSVVEVLKIAGKSHSVASDLKMKLEEVKLKAEKVVNHTQSSKEQLGKDIKAIFVKIKRMRDDVNKIFDDLEAYITEETSGFQAEVTNKLIKKTSNCEKHIADAIESLEIVDTALQNGSPSQQFIVEQRIRNQVNALSSDVGQEYQKMETATAFFEFDETLKLLPSLSFDYIPGKLTLNYSLHEAKKPLVSPIVKLTKIASIDLNQTGDDTRELLYTGMDFLSDGRLVAVDNKNKKCLLYNENLEKVGSYQLSYIPQSVVAVSEEEVAITGANVYKIDFLRVSKSNEIIPIRTCKVKTQYDSICLKDDGHFVVGTINDTRPVRIVSLSGEEKDFSISFPYKKYSSNTSACTYSRDTGKVILVDRYEHIVYIYDVSTKTSVVVKGDEIKEPHGVVVGPLDCILVCSTNTNSIVQVSQTGVILASYNLEMKFPSTVCVSKNKSILAVTNKCKGKRKLQLLRCTYSE